MKGRLFCTQADYVSWKTVMCEAHPLDINKVNPTITLSISILLLINLMSLLGFIIPILLVTALGPRLASSISTLDFPYLDELLLVYRNLLLIILVWETNDSMVGCITTETIITV